MSSLTAPNKHDDRDAIAWSLDNDVPNIDTINVFMKYVNDSYNRKFDLYMIHKFIQIGACYIGDYLIPKYILSSMSQDELLAAFNFLFKDGMKDYKSTDIEKYILKHVVDNMSRVELLAAFNFLFKDGLKYYKSTDIEKYILKQAIDNMSQDELQTTFELMFKYCLESYKSTDIEYYVFNKINLNEEFIQKQHRAIADSTFVVIRDGDDYIGALRMSLAQLSQKCIVTHLLTEYNINLPNYEKIKLVLSTIVRSIYMKDGDTVINKDIIRLILKQIHSDDIAQFAINLIRRERYEICIALIECGFDPKSLYKIDSDILIKLEQALDSHKRRHWLIKYELYHYTNELIKVIKDGT